MGISPSFQPVLTCVGASSLDSTVIVPLICSSFSFRSLPIFVTSQGVWNYDFVRPCDWDNELLSLYLVEFLCVSLLQFV
jgi:hypothetical protein